MPGAEEQLIMRAIAYVATSRYPIPGIPQVQIRAKNRHSSKTSYQGIPCIPSGVSIMSDEQYVGGIPAI